MGRKYYACSVMLVILLAVFIMPALAATQSSMQSPARLYPFLSNGLWGYIDRTGRVIVKPTLEWADDFAEGMGRIRVNGKYGFINTVGKLVVIPQYAEAEQFSDGLAQVTIKRNVKKASFPPHGGSSDPYLHQFAWIDRNGKEVLRKIAADAGSFHNGYATATLDKLEPVYLDKKGNKSFGRRFSQVNSFSEGLAFEEEVIGYTGDYERTSAMICIDAKGHQVFKNKDSMQCWSFSDGLARMEIDRTYGYMNTTGQVVISPRFTSGMTGDFHDGRARIECGERQWRFIDKSGGFIPGQYESASNFSEGLAAVRINKKWGYINTAGAMVIDPRFDTARQFIGGLACVHDPGNSEHPAGIGYIDKSGKYVWGPTE